MALQFEWDLEKATQNVRRDGGTLEEAATVFQDPLDATVPDLDPSVDEARYITIGLSCRARLLMASHAERGHRLRIIGARELTQKARRQYKEGNW